VRKMTGIRCSPSLKVLTEEQVDRIHEASLAILDKTGIRFDSEDARKRLVKAGALMHASRKDVVIFPRSLIEETIAKVPRRVTYYARNPKQDVVYDGEHTYPYAGGGDPKILDLETGRPRPSTLEDVEAASRLGDALEHNHFAANLVMANDVPPELVTLKTMEAALRNSSKTISSYTTDRKTVEFMVRMCQCVVGGEEAFRKRPLLSLASSPSSPLTYAEHVCDVLIRSAELGVPFSLVPCPIAGETGPMTLSGSIAQQNAETLGGLVLIQTVDSELATTYCGRVCIMDPRSGRDLWAVPEQVLASAAMVQIARRYKMVSDVSGMTSDIPRWDVQMGLERMMAVLVPFMAGADSISGIGGAWEGASSLEMMVIDNEIWNDIARLSRGIEVDSEGLAVDLVDKVGPMGSFLAQPHTMNAIRKGEFRVSPLWDKRSSDKAVREGFKPIQEAAHEKAKRILKEHVPEALDRNVLADIDMVLREASRQLV